ncbi:hypothetical protein BDV3_002482 [Batrachochytrium dendrobatidis]|uniref:TATA box binding protein associated factor (TAF) histone-like fold domain-containing protein n=1 Tax=Batrachochytrium dendrobatidis (strain JEL423) TaxID=403673 RepID=A0A177WXE1_BATDL|nr:histone H4-like TAF Taf6, SAGA complex subunit [Batrachochytrium dendrobatidis]KAK5667674.1 histone H4-like TAF Taf6, SAGA complex subunit [Batrachochytrium dendrobatidis]OAJ44295.1 hypothetical protein BDEG_27542 [Batrachochytrium dendrobatidis JEL423]
MSVFPKETILAIAESVGVSMQDEVATVLLQDTEYRMREIIHEAVKFMRHSRRQKLTSADINSALSVRNVEPLYGYINGAPSNFKMTSMGSQVLYYLEDQEYDLDDLINRPLPPVPLEATYTAHWLAVDGAQPRIVQNPTPSDGQTTTETLQATTSTIRRGEKSLTSTSDTTQHPLLVKEVLTKELQMYYEKITEMLTSEDLEIRSLAIESISKDPGVQGIMPYFVQFISDTVTRSLKDLELLWTIMRFTRGILSNVDLDPEPYLHQLIPSILTCIVAKRMTRNSSGETAGDEDHWALRLYSAKLAAHICVQFGGAYPTLQPRVTKTLLRAMLDPLKPLATVYGALAALAALGKQVVCALVLPNVAALGMRLERQTQSPDSPLPIDVTKCTDLIQSLVLDQLHMDLTDAMVVANAETALSNSTVDRATIIASLREEWAHSRPLGIFTDRIWNAFEQKQ